MNTRASLMVPRAAAGTKLRQIEQAREMQKIVDERASRTAVDAPPYEFLEYIGRGSFGRVYKCKHRETQKIVAVKITEVDDADYKAYFEDKDRSLPDLLREIKVLQQLKETRAGDYVNVIYDAFPMYSELWLITEYCPGGSVTTLMKAAPGGLEEKYIVTIARELATALKYVHEANVIHRDIKCSNILVTEDGNIQLGDFGVSGVLETEAAKRSTIVGTLHWMPPELLEANLSSNYTKYPVAPLYRHEVDIWAFGCTVYEMAMGHGPMTNARTLPELAATAQDKPPRLEGERFSEGLKSLVAFCIEAKPENRPTADEILQHDYLRDTSKSHPSSNLRELLERFVKWETSGGARASLFHPQMGAAAPELPLPQDEDDEDWTFSTSDDLDEEDYVIDLGDEATTKPTSKPPSKASSASFTVPRTKQERESMVRRGGQGLQRLFDPSDSTPYVYGSNDLALRQYGTEGGNNRETIIDLDDVGLSFTMPALDLGDVPTLRANRLNREALDRVIAELREEDNREAQKALQDDDYTKRATRDWKFPMMEATEPANRRTQDWTFPMMEAATEPRNRKTQDWTFPTMGTEPEPNNRKTQDWTFASAIAEAGASSGYGETRDILTKDLQSSLLTTPAEQRRDRRTRDFVFPPPIESEDTDVVDFAQQSQLGNNTNSDLPDDFRPIPRHAATQPLGGFGHGYADQTASAPDSPLRTSMIDLDFAMPTEYQFRPTTSDSAGDTAPFGVEYNSANPFDLEDQVHLSESNNRLSYHTKSQSEPTKTLPGLLTPGEEQEDSKRGSKYGLHSRGTSQAMGTTKSTFIPSQPPQQPKHRPYRRRWPRRDLSVSSRSNASASETEPDDDSEIVIPSPTQLTNGMLQNNYWSRYNHANNTTHGDWNRSLLSRSSSIADRGDLSGTESDAISDDKIYPFDSDIMALNESEFSTAPPQKGVRTPAEAFSGGMRPIVNFPVAQGPDPEALKHDAEPEIVERELKRMCQAFIRGVKICNELVAVEGTTLRSMNGHGYPRLNGDPGDGYTDAGTESEGISM